MIKQSESLAEMSLYINSKYEISPFVMQAILLQKSGEKYELSSR